LAFGSAPKKLGSINGSMTLWMLAENIGQPRRNAENERDESE